MKVEELEAFDWLTDAMGMTMQSAYAHHYRPVRWVLSARLSRSLGPVSAIFGLPVVVDHDNEVGYGLIVKGTSE